MSDLVATHPRVLEIRRMIEFLRCAAEPRGSVYVSSPVTTGRRFAEWRAKRPVAGDVDTAGYAAAHAQHVVDPNRRQSESVVTRIRASTTRPVVDPAAVGILAGWEQHDYRHLWGEVIREFGAAVVFSPEWQFSDGCAYEFAVAAHYHVPALDDQQRPIDPAVGTQQINMAARELSALGCPSEFLEHVRMYLADDVNRLPPEVLLRQ